MQPEIFVYMVAILGSVSQGYGSGTRSGFYHFLKINKPSRKTSSVITTYTTITKFMNAYRATLFVTKRTACWAVPFKQCRGTGTVTFSRSGTGTLIFFHLTFFLFILYNKFDETYQFFLVKNLTM